MLPATGTGKPRNAPAKKGIRQLLAERDALDPADPRWRKLNAAIERKRKKRDRPSPTKLTRAWMTERGIEFEVVEQRKPYSFITVDFCNFADAIGFSPSFGICAVQITGDTDGGNHAKRRTKIEAEPRAVAWLKSGGRVEVHSWSLRGKAGDEKEWALRRDRAYLAGERIAWVGVE